ncbi:hypothetical protein WG922_01150 [Ramlibacter sp. AN1015]|uniref:hypothetical protein n=1 Tax=Ramlibacter sp. AN1015 TaxID=3133428 RepID=UPI0030BF4AE4
MNRIVYSIAYGTTVAAAALSATLIAVTARAEGPIAVESSMPFAASRTRADVLTEVIDSRAEMRAANEWTLNQQTFQPRADGPTRAQVAAEFINARQEVQARTGEDSGSAYLAEHVVQVPPGRMLAGSSLR